MRGVIARRRQASDERGASLVLFVLSLVMIMGMASLVIDLGQGWWTRRALIPGTDAAALAAAQDYARGGTGCPTAAATYLAQNHPAATMVSCTPFNYSVNQGRVTVTATAPVQTSFGKVLGFGDYTVPSATSAVWGPPATVSGLRPIGLCINSSAALQNLFNNPVNVDTDITVLYGSNQPNGCGGSPGNWGIIDFGGGGNSTAELNQLLLNGYTGQVAFQNHVVASCSGEPHCYNGDTGAVSNSLGGSLDTLISRGIYFGVPIFNYVEGTGNTSRFHIIGFIRARLLDYHITGNQAQRTFTFRVRPGLITGTCCGPADGTSGNKVVAICGVDPSLFTACEP